MTSVGLLHHNLCHGFSEGRFQGKAREGASARSDAEIQESGDVPCLLLPLWSDGLHVHRPGALPRKPPHHHRPRPPEPDQCKYIHRSDTSVGLSVGLWMKYSFVRNPVLPWTATFQSKWKCWLQVTKQARRPTFQNPYHWPTLLWGTSIIRSLLQRYLWIKLKLQCNRAPITQSFNSSAGSWLKRWKSEEFDPYNNVVVWVHYWRYSP